MRDEIEKRLTTKVILENDANSAAMGENWLGAAREYDHMAMYTLGTGVGGGLMFNGRLWHGMTGMAGELGHFNIYADGHPCGCGSRGCLEQYASATAIVRMAREAIARGESAELERLSHDPVQFSFAFDLQPLGARRSSGEGYIRERRTGPGHWSRRNGQRSQSPDLRDWWWRIECLGRLCSSHV